MSPRFGREPFNKDHDRARELAAARLTAPLVADQADFLDAHLGWCAPCRAVEAEYEGQRIALRSLRLDAPTPPRDLRARTFAAIEAESRPVARSRNGRGRVRGRQPFPVAPLAGLMIVATAVGVSLLNGVPLLNQQGTRSPIPGSTGPGATPIPVTAREVPLVRRTADGTLVLSVGRVAEVCPLDTDACGSTATIDRREIGRIDAGTASDVLLSPTRSHLVVLDRSASGGIYVFAIAQIPAPSTSPAPTPNPDLTSDPATTPTPGSTASLDPTPIPTPTATLGPTAPPTSGPSPTPVPTSSLVPTPPPTATAEPTDPAVTDPPPSGQPASPTPQATPPVAVSPQPGGAISIAEDVVLVGTIAGYSADGSAFAFTARPADGSTGPDVYVWRTSDSHARPVTLGHDVVFADWIGGQLLVSRAVEAEDGMTAVPATSLLDPFTGVETPLLSDAPVWRPAVDPLLRAGVWWEGTVARDASGFAWLPDDGALVIGTWPGLAAATDPEASPAASGRNPATPASPATPVLPPATSGSAAPATPDGSRVRVLAEGPVPDWQVRWDETGGRVAVWIAGIDDVSLGLLSLYVIDPSTGMIADGEPLLRDAVAYEGFSIGSGRLAWTAPADDGQTVVEVLAWTENNVGQVRLVPGDRSVVVR